MEIFIDISATIYGCYNAQLCADESGDAPQIESKIWRPVLCGLPHPPVAEVEAIVPEMELDICEDEEEESPAGLTVWAKASTSSSMTCHALGSPSSLA